MNLILNSLVLVKHLSGWFANDEYGKFAVSCKTTLETLGPNLDLRRPYYYFWSLRRIEEMEFCRKSKLIIVNGDTPHHEIVLHFRKTYPKFKTATLDFDNIRSCAWRHRMGIVGVDDDYYNDEGHEHRKLEEREYLQRSIDLIDSTLDDATYGKLIKQIVFECKTMGYHRYTYFQN